VNNIRDTLVCIILAPLFAVLGALFGFIFAAVITIVAIAEVFRRG
jgi:hypothetical protein